MEVKIMNTYDVVNIKDGKFKGFSGEVININKDIASVRLDELNVIQVPIVSLEKSLNDYIILLYNIGYAEIVKIVGKYRATAEEINNTLSVLYKKYCYSNKLLNVIAIPIDDLKNYNLNLSKELSEYLFMEYINNMKINSAIVLN
jgi:ribosomal protein L24